MQPIISPWVFYIAALSDNLLVLSTIGGGVFAFLWYWCYDTEKKTGQKICAILFAVCVLLVVFIPTEKTIYKMVAASIVTPDNISAVQGNTVDFIQKVAEAVIQVKQQ